MSMTAIRLLIGRRAGTIALVPAAVAARLLECGQAEKASAREAAEAERVRDGDPEIESRDPAPARGPRAR